MLKPVVGSASVKQTYYSNRSGQTAFIVSLHEGPQLLRLHLRNILIDLYQHLAGYSGDMHQKLQTSGHARTWHFPAFGIHPLLLVSRNVQNIEYIYPKGSLCRR